MTIKDAHQLNAGDTVKIKVSDYKTIQTQIESVSVSETGPIIWYYDFTGTLQRAEACNIEAVKVAKELNKVKHFLDFLNERIERPTSAEAESIYITVKESFKNMFCE